MDKDTYKILKLISTKEHFSIWDLNFILGDSVNAHEPIDWLLTQGYIKCYFPDDMSPESEFCITYEGKVALASKAELDRKTFYIELRAWLTLAIALAAFIKSFFF